MIRCVVDTNVPIVANGRAGLENAQIPSPDCRLAAVTFLLELARNGRTMLDLAGAIQAEYRRHLNPRGQPGVGDRFYQVILHSAPHLVERVDLPLRDDGEYEHLPQSLIDLGFDPSDRKFAALARRANAPVINATDSDWVNAAGALTAESIEVRHICGSDTKGWFSD